MLNNSELLQLYQRLGLSQKAQLTIEEIRSSPPVRRVQSGNGNVSARYPSRKMGVIIQAESHKNELAGVYEKEHDPDTLEYYDQPGQIKLEYQARSGRPVAVFHTPDYFVIRTDGVGWEEWKTEDKLIELVEQMPHRYCRDDEGRWRCPPGEQYAEPLGFFYWVRSSVEINWALQRNMLFLEDYLRVDCPAVNSQATEEVIRLVTNEPGIMLEELLERTEIASRDDIYTLIATEQVYVDLYAAPLPKSDQIRVFRNEATAQAYIVMAETTSASTVPRPHPVEVAPGQSVIWDGKPWTIANFGEAMTTLLGRDGATVVELAHSTFEALVKQGRITGLVQPEEPMNAAGQELLLRASEEDMQEANRRYQIVKAMLNNSLPADDPTPERTRRRWVARYHQAEQRYGSGYLGLLPQLWKSGNRQRKLPEKTLTLMNDFIDNRYETLKQKKKLEVYGELVCACEEKAIIAPSYLTFAKAINQRPRQEQTMKRAGHRKAYVYEPFYFELTLTTPRHGDRPFEIGHIDHTELDVELVCSRTGRNLGRPWATFLVDAFSRRLLAVYLTYERPSYRACMMILRECVYRHGRLPQIVIVDGGSEFASTYFETLLARYECTKKTRPGAKPRFGSVCERLFGTSNTRFVHNLLGNTQLTRHIRQVTHSTNPKRLARWSLGRLYARLGEWAYEIYDTIDHPALGQSPREAFTQGLARSGQRSHRLIPFDETFRMLTLPTTGKGTALVQPNLGVKINYIYYWSDAFHDSQVERTQVPVRYDPFDAGIAYAFVKNHWVQSVSEYYASFKGRSEREMMLATAELRQQHLNHGRQFTVTARKLAEFITSLEAEEALLEQRLRDAEGRDVLLLTHARQIYGNGLEVTASLEPKQQDVEPERSLETAGSAEHLTIYGDF